MGGKDGCDGAGSQPEIKSKEVHHILNKEEEGPKGVKKKKDLKSLELVGFVPLELVDISGKEKGLTNEVSHKSHKITKTNLIST